MGDFEEETQTTISNPWVRAFLNIKYTANYLNRLDEDYFAKFGLSAQQFNALRILRGASKSIKVSEIRNRMVEKPPNMSRLLDKLNAKSYIKRQRSKGDRRTVYCKITEEGLSLLAEMDQHEFQLPLGHLKEEDVKLISSLMDKVRGQ